MGWKAFAVFATAVPGYFGTRPRHETQRAEQLRLRLGLSGYEYVGPATLDAALYPRKGALYIGAYPDGAIVCETQLACQLFDAASRRRIGGGAAPFAEFRPALLGLYPDGEVLALVLHSVVNLWGYSLYAAGKLRRSAAGASDDGIIANEGEPLAEERRVLDACAIEEVDEEVGGEELVFDVSARMFGLRLDAFEEFHLELSQYRRAPGSIASFFKKMLGKQNG
jgi:hypothetical protein